MNVPWPPRHSYESQSSADAQPFVPSTLVFEAANSTIPTPLDFYLAGYHEIT